MFATLKQGRAGMGIVRLTYAMSTALSFINFWVRTLNPGREYQVRMLYSNLPSN